MNWDSNKYDMKQTLPVKFQHLVMYTKDLVTCHQWYRNLFKLQFSAQNDPDGSALMSLAAQSMHFFSFGHYHHDLAFAKKKDVTPDNTSFLNFSMRLRGDVSLADFIKRLEDYKVTYKHGRLLQSARTPEGLQAVCFQDPNGYWVEIFGI